MLISELSKKTYLHDWHTAHHAKMPPFGGYDMPLWYASAKNEHLAVLRSAGLFDTSHMAVVNEYFFIIFIKLCPDKRCRIQVITRRLPLVFTRLQR